MTMTARTILQTFDEYRKARMHFVSTVGELALRPQNVEILKAAGVLGLLRPLLCDVSANIQQCAALALGRIAHHDKSIGHDIARGDTLPLLLKNIDKRSRHYKKGAMFVIRAICQHEPEMAQAVINAGGLDALMVCLADLDPSVKEAAAWAVGYVARHGRQLARPLVDVGAVPNLVLCLQEPEVSVKRVAASALADIAKHGTDLAQMVIDAGALCYLSAASNNRDVRLKRQALNALACVAKHTPQLAECCVQADVFPRTLVNMGHQCPLVRRNAAILVRDVVRHTLELAQLIMNLGGVGALVETVKGAEAPTEPEGDYRVPAVTALGYLAGHCPQLANCVVSFNGVTAIASVLKAQAGKPITELASVAVWALGQIGRYCPEPVAGAGVLPRLLELANHPDASQELRSRCVGALKQSVKGCNTLSALEPLLYNSPPEILKNVLGQFAKLLPNDPRARRLFVTTGGLKRIQEIEAEPGTAIMEYIAMINSCFPEEIVRYYSPGYSESLLEQVESFKPTLNMDDDQDILMDRTKLSFSPSQELDALFGD